MEYLSATQLGNTKITKEQVLPINEWKVRERDRMQIPGSEADMKCYGSLGSAWACTQLCMEGFRQKQILKEEEKFVREKTGRA